MVTLDLINGVGKAQVKFSPGYEIRGMPTIYSEAFNAMEVFVGRDNVYNGEEDIGNTMLIREHDLEYILVTGEGVFGFLVMAPITQYFSPNIQNDVSLPYAIDKDGNYYDFYNGAIFVQNAYPNPGEEPQIHEMDSDYHWNGPRSSNPKTYWIPLLMKKLMDRPKNYTN